MLHILDTRELMAPPREPSLVSWSWKRFWAALGLGAAGGFGGATAMLLLGITTKQLKMEFDVENIARLFSLGLVSGFLGFRLLKSVADKVDKQIQENIEKSEQRQDEKMVEMQKRLFEEAGYIDQAKTALSKNATVPELEALAGILYGMHQRGRNDRRLGIVLGNLYDRLGREVEAVNVVTEVIQNRTEKGFGKTKDTADLLYNRACYRVPSYLKAKAQTNASEMKGIIGDIITDLTLSFQYFPPNKQIALQDDDLNRLRGDTNYDAFIAS